MAETAGQALVYSLDVLRQAPDKVRAELRSPDVIVAIVAKVSDPERIDDDTIVAVAPADALAEVLTSRGVDGIVANLTANHLLGIQTIEPDAYHIDVGARLFHVAAGAVLSGTYAYGQSGIDLSGSPESGVHDDDVAVEEDDDDRARFRCDVNDHIIYAKAGSIGLRCPRLMDDKPCTGHLQPF